MQRIASLANTRAAILPMTRSADVRTVLVGKKYIGASIETLSMPLQTPRTLGQWCEVGIVGNDDEHVDVLGIGFGGRDRAQNGNPPNAGNLPGRRHELTQSIEQRFAVTLWWEVHRPVSIQRRNVAERHQHLDRPSLAKGSPDKATPFESDNHAVN